MVRNICSRLSLAMAMCCCGSVLAEAQNISPPAGSAPVAGTGQDLSPVWLTAWLGGGATDNLVGGYVGGIAAVTGNLWVDGVVIRVDFLGGRYRYSSTAFPRVNVWMSGGDVLIGYRTKIGNTMLTGLVGPTFQHHDNPDPTAPIRGGEFGVMGHLESDTDLSQSLKLYALARYATTFSTFSATGRLKYRAFDKVQVGPEASYLSNKNYREAQFGAAVSFEVPFGEVRLSGGHLTRLTPGPDGYYFQVYLGRDFH